MVLINGLLFLRFDRNITLTFRQENESKFLNIDLSNKLPTKTAKDIADRAKVVFAGIEVFSRLAMEGVPPDKYIHVYHYSIDVEEKIL